ncbi:MAG TPA: PA14 domain-containing protein, partial [Phycisphaerae bacterium]|nr:PA14 domain-containing protein [Phycisphaerae bacterium]
MLRTVSVALLTCVVIAGCGDRKPTKRPAPAKKPPKTRPATMPATVPATVPTTAPTTGPATAPATQTAPTTKPALSPFQQKLQDVLALENDAELSEALMLARKAKREFRSHPDARALDEIMARLKEERRTAHEMPVAIKSLAAPDHSAVTIAKRKLIAADRLGKIYLRLALRKESVKIAKGAAEVLTEVKDANSLPLFVGRLEKEPRSGLTLAIMDGLRQLVESLKSEQLATCLRLIKKDRTFDRRELVGVMSTCLDEVCGGDKAKFNGLVQDANGYEAVRAYVERALVSEKPDVVECACTYGGSFSSFSNGVKGQYFADKESKKLAFERVDQEIQWGSRVFPYPDGRQDYITIRWQGLIEVKRAGNYTFHLAADDNAKLWVNGKKVVEGGTAASAPIKLDAGLHPFKLDFYQDTGGSAVALSWSGPGIAKTAAIPFRTAPTKEIVLGLTPALRDLLSSNWVLSRAAKVTFAGAGELGRIVLRNAVANKPEEIAKRAVDLLVKSDDDRTIPVLIERLKKDPNAAMVESLVDGLRSLATHVDPNELAWFRKQVAADVKLEMKPHATALCAVLDRVCGGDGAKLNTLLADPNAHDDLTAYVEKCLESKDPNVVARACRYGHPIAPLLPGLRGRYFRGEQFDDLAIQRQDAGVSVEPQKFPFPDNRQSQISAVWDGFVR